MPSLMPFSRPPLSWRHASVVLFALFLTATATVSAQPTTRPFPSTSTIDRDALKPLAGTSSDATASGELPAIERAVDPATYRVGPFDQLLLAIRNPALDDQYVPLSVTADDRVILPRGGAVDVTGMSIRELERTVDSLYTSRSSHYSISLALLKPRRIYVDVKGDVLNPGRYVFTAADRVTTAIDAANRVQESTPEEKIREQDRRTNQRGAENTGKRDVAATTMSMLPPRTVVVRHNDGSTNQADLTRYAAFGADLDNPTLREGDEIYVHRPSISDPLIFVTGAVNAPGAYAYRPGDNALMLWRLGAGSRPDAVPDKAHITRQGATGLDEIDVDLSDTTALAAISIQAGDRLVIPSRSAMVGPRAGVVTVNGEVMHPGQYPITDGHTTLSQVIADAGGVTPRASLAGSYINRPDGMNSVPSATANVQNPIAKMSTSALRLDDSSRYVYDATVQAHRVSADFEAVLRGDASRDVVLRHGDVINIPTDPGGVFVSGRVAYPGWVTYRKGATVDDYIKAAGGLTEAADEDRVSVVKFGTGMWRTADYAKIDAGDEIYVPGRQEPPPRTALEQTQTIVGILGAVVSITLAVASFVIAHGN